MGTGTTEKPLRADAARNRRKLLDAATEAFTSQGGDVPLDEVARAAGVGIGTLYRHFPTREDLVLAIYAEQVDALVRQADELPHDLPAGEALHEWMRGFVDYYAVKMGMVNLLRPMMEGRADTFTQTRSQMLEAAGRVLRGAIDAKAVRSDITPQELIRALGGICLASTTPEGQETSLALADLIFDGLRYGTKE